MLCPCLFEAALSFGKMWNDVYEIRNFEWSKVENLISFSQVNKIDQEHGYEIVVTVDLSGLKDFEQVELEAANEIGTYSARLLCPKANSGPKAQSCSFFNVFTCPESSTYSQLALTVGVVLLIVLIVIGLILCYHISR